MTPIQQLFLGTGSAVATKTYVDDVFSTFLYTGNGSSRTINTGFDVNTDGGMVWLKQRSSSNAHFVYDTERGAGYQIFPNETYGQPASADSSRLSAFTSTGFSLGSDSEVNGNNATYSSWNLAKAPGFFDVVTYSGSGSAKTVAHSLGSIPGLILIKCTSHAADWAVGHRSLDSYTNFLRLNNTGAAGSSTAMFNGTAPTSSVFSVGDSDKTNESGKTYVAYVFAGGASTQNEAVSVDMDGTGDYINTTSSSSDFTMGTGDFTVEGWFKCDNDNTNRGLFQISPVSGGLTGTNFNDTISVNISISSNFKFNANGAFIDSGVKCEKGQWYHLALVRNSGTTSLYINGILAKSNTDTNDYDGTYIAVSGYWDFGYVWDGPISNFRVVKGTAVYTSSFRPPTEPLTNISGTVLLCCNNSSVTGSTVTPVTLISQGNPTASTDSPFDDPAAHVFGESGSESVIKCGSYVGSGSSGLEVNLGWEPSFVMYKRTDSTGDWIMSDSMRGAPTAGIDSGMLKANDSDSEAEQSYISLTSTGFTLPNTFAFANGSGNNYIYIAIRRSDGYVGKPPELGTDVFAMDAGGSSSTIPNYDSNFPVDFAIEKYLSGSQSWFTSARLIAKNYVETDNNIAEVSNNAYVFDSNVGWFAGSGSNSSYQSWMWKRHAGFDVVNYKGNGVSGLSISHSMNAAPEMMFIKRRDATQAWLVYHTGLNGGSGNTYEYGINLEDSVEWQEGSSGEAWGGADPTSSHFTVGELSTNNTNNGEYLALLFSSITNISKVGVYAGSNSAQSISLGFQPRFVIIKNTANSDDWIVLDTTRGWGSGDDKRLKLNDNAAQSDQAIGEPTSTGFDLAGNVRYFNQAGRYYIYYAHA